MIWKDIIDYEGIYKISEYGDVKVIATGQKRTKGMIKKPYVISSGYLRMDLSKKGKFKHFRLHRLVAAAFIGPCPDGKQVNHKDGNKKNNHYTNLEYVTFDENIKHAIMLGLCKFVSGEDHGNAKLTNKNVRWIKKQLNKSSYRLRGNKNKIQLYLASKFNVSISAIRQLASGRSWKAVK